MAVAEKAGKQGRFMHTRADIEELAEDFENCRKVLVALGDENRQHLIHVLQRAKVLTEGLTDRGEEN